MCDGIKSTFQPNALPYHHYHHHVSVYTIVVCLIVTLSLLSSNQEKEALNFTINFIYYREKMQPVSYKEYGELLQ